MKCPEPLCIFYACIFIPCLRDLFCFSNSDFQTINIAFLNENINFSTNDNIKLFYRHSCDLAGDVIWKRWIQITFENINYTTFTLHLLTSGLIWLCKCDTKMCWVLMLTPYKWGTKTAWKMFWSKGQCLLTNPIRQNIIVCLIL